MDDEQILERGGTQEDINEYAKQNGADLTKEDVEMDSLQTKIKAILPKEKKGYFPSHDNTDHHLQGYNQALSDIHSSIPKLIEIVREEERAEVYQDLYDACEGDFDAIDTISEFISAIKKKKK